MRMQKRMWGKAVTSCSEELCCRLCGKYEEISPNSCLIQKLFVPVILELLGSVQIVIFAWKHNSVERAINCSCLPSKFRRRNFLLMLTTPWMRHFIFRWKLTNPSRRLQFSSPPRPSPPEKRRDITALHAGYTSGSQRGHILTAQTQFDFKVGRPLCDVLFATVTSGSAPPR